MPSTLPAVFSAETRPLNENGEDQRENSGNAEPTLTPGTELGRYVVIEPLGSGGMGVVLRAYDPKLQREVALKLLRSDILDDTAAERMIREAQAMAQLAHPNVVAVYDVEQSDSTVVLAMELVEGCTVGKWLSEEEPSASQILEVFVQAGRGLAAAHDAGLVHRDFKPANVLVGDDGRVRVTDFGLARPVAGRIPARPTSTSYPSSSLRSSSGSQTDLHSRVTLAGTVMGTPNYMAPEQHEGDEANAKADQFAFCVTLWQALHGTRPFAERFHEITGAKTLGPPPLPAESTVPRRIAEAIRRGLEPDPKDRWPSMDPLLRVLARDPSRNRLRWITAGALGVATLATVAAVATYWGRQPGTCGGARDHLAGIWDPPRRVQAAEALRATGLEYAERTWVAVERRLDDYAESWVEMHTEACESTSVRREQSAAVLDLRMNCLERGLLALEATAEVLAHADASVVESAINLVSELPPLSTCENLEALKAAVPPPEDPLLADAVDQARRELSRAWAIGNVGGQTKALAILAAVEERALVYEPLRAELDFQRGRRLSDLRRYDEAEVASKDAYLRALRVGHRRIAIQALAGLGFSVGANRLQQDESMRLLQIALAMAERDGDTVLKAIVLSNMGGVLQIHAHHEQALERFSLALELQREFFGEEHPAITTTLSNLAISMHHLGNFDRSFELRAESLERERRIFGEEHPRVARMLHVLGNDLHQWGDYEASAERFGQALEMRSKLLGPEHPDTAHSQTGLGLALTALGRYAEAERRIRGAFEILQREAGIERLETMDTLNALAIAVHAQGRYEESLALHRRVLEAIEGKLGPEHPRTAIQLTNVGGALVTLHRYQEAMPLLERAVEIQLAASGPGHPHLAIFEINLASALVELDRPAEAEELYRRTIPIMEAAFGTDHYYLSDALVGLGRALHAQGERERALPWLERGFMLRDSKEAPDHERAAAGFALAQALGDDQRARARPLALRARALFAGAGPGHALDLKETSAWLVAHPG